jgi:hypothetical protein
VDLSQPKADIFRDSVFHFPTMDDRASRVNPKGRRFKTDGFVCGDANEQDANSVEIKVLASECVRNGFVMNA